MKLILVHGINNQNRTTDDIQSSWMQALRRGWQQAGLDEPSDYEIATANYGTELAQFADAKEIAPRETVMAGTSTRAVSPEELAFYQEFAKSYGLTDEQILTAGREEGIDMSAVPQAFPHEGWLIAIANGLLKLVPDLERPIIRAFLRQAAVYIENHGVRLAIKSIVRNQVLLGGNTERAVFVGHSLGSVVTYELLAIDKAYGGTVPLFMTIGSPLAVDSFGRLLGRHNRFPNPPVGLWCNGRHKKDFVTLARPIVKETLGFEGVEDITEIDNHTGNKHSDVHYLSSPAVATRIHAALSGA